MTISYTFILYCVTINFLLFKISAKLLEFELNVTKIPLKESIKYSNFTNDIISRQIVPLHVINQEVLTMQVCLGTPEQCFNVLYDTGSYHLWLASKYSLGCYSCKLFDEDSSSTFERKNNLLIIKYVTGSATGYEAIDYLKINGRSKKFSWLLALSVEFNLEGVDGIIGFAREYAPDRANSYVSEKFSFIDSLLQAKIINRKVFSQVFTDEDFTKAKLYIGEYPEDFSNSKNYSFCNIINKDSFLSQSNIKNLWACRLSYILIGSPKKINFHKQSFKVDSRAVLDSGSNYILASYDMAYVLKEIFLNFSECYDDFDASSGIKFFSCSENFDLSKFPSFSLILNGYAYTINSKRLFKEIILNGHKNFMFCIIFSKRMDFWLLGQYFLRNFHILFDYEKSIIAFNGNTDYITDFRKYTDDNDYYEFDYWLQIFLLFLVIAVLVLWMMYFVFKKCANYANEDVDPNNLLSRSGIINNRYYFNRF